MTTTEVLRLRRRLDDEFAFPCDLQTLGNTFAYSPSYILRAFRDSTGLTPLQYVESLRYQRAKRLLVESDDSVAEICFEVGYQSVPSFVRRFKEVHGCTPTEFRLRQRRFWQGWTPSRAPWIPSYYVTGPAGFGNLR